RPLAARTLDARDAARAGVRARVAEAVDADGLTDHRAGGVPEVGAVVDVGAVEAELDGLGRRGRLLEAYERAGVRVVVDAVGVDVARRELPDEHELDERRADRATHPVVFAGVEALDLAGAVAAVEGHRVAVVA